MKPGPRYKGLKLHLFNGVPYVARKDIRNYHGHCSKRSKGRYYMPLTQYIWGRRSYLISVFRMRTWQIIHEARRKRDGLKSAINERVRTRRRMKLVQDLKKLDFERSILQSSLYRRVQERIRERHTCGKCGSTRTEFNNAWCECHACEDWFGCSSGSSKPAVFRECLQCGFSQRV